MPRIRKGRRILTGGCEPEGLESSAKKPGLAEAAGDFRAFGVEAAIADAERGATLNSLQIRRAAVILEWFTRK